MTHDFNSHKRVPTRYPLHVVDRVGLPASTVVRRCGQMARHAVDFPQTSFPHRFQCETGSAADLSLILKVALTDTIGRV